MIHTSNFVEKLLREPYLEGNDELLIISGYGSSRFLDYVINVLPNIKVTLVLGMASQGIPKFDYELYKKICASNMNIKVKFQLDSPPTHMKIYQWLKKGSPTKCYIGSANFSYSGFINNNEIMTLVNGNCLDLVNFYIERAVSLLEEDLLTKSLTLFSSKLSIQEQIENESYLNKINKDNLINYQLKRYEYDNDYTEVVLLFKNGLNRGLRDRYNSYLDINKNSTFFDKHLPIGKKGIMRIGNLKLHIIRKGHFGRQLHILHDYYDFYTIILDLLSLDRESEIDYAALIELNLKSIKFKYIDGNQINMQI